MEWNARWAQCAHSDFPSLSIFERKAGLNFKRIEPEEMWNEKKFEHWHVRVRWSITDFSFFQPPSIHSASHLYI